jgi:hypothetical protein
VRSDELGQPIRAWRDRLDPVEAGLSTGTRRRASGLRREETGRFRQELVSDPHAALGAYPEDERLAALIADPRARSEDAEKLALVGVVGLQGMAR